MFSSVIERLNNRRSGAGESGADAGFTLIELMVVLLILAILLAIAIPTFLGVTGGANDRAAQSNLNTALTTVKAQASQNQQSYAGLGVATFKTNEPSISWVTGAVGDQGPVSVYVDTPDGNGVVLSSWSSSNGGTCWYAVDNIGQVSNYTSNGAYTAANPSPVTSPGAAPPTDQGTFYGKAQKVGKAACGSGASDSPIPATTTWGTKYPS
jgi:type IV pilus assembly protein PilA